MSLCSFFIDMVLPKDYISYTRCLLKDEYLDYASSLSNKSLDSIRINNIKISNDDFFLLSKENLEKVPWSDNGYYIKNKSEYSKSIFYYLGLYYIQEPSAMAPSHFLPIDKNDIVLDMCAAPGGKSFQILNKLNGTGLLISNDISKSRIKALVKNLEMQGSCNYMVTCEDGDVLSSNYKSYFDKILIDAPCSGEGMFRKDKTLIGAWSKEKRGKYAHIQINLLESAIKMIKPGGLIMFSTCTFNMIENEGVISSILKKYDDIELLDIPKIENFVNGIDTDNVNLKKCKRLYPHKIKGEGHFIALLHKKNNNYLPKKSERKRKYRTIDNESAINFLVKRCGLNIEKIYEKNNYINYISKIEAIRDKVHIVKSGVYLGEIKKDKFIPSQALAFLLDCNSFDNCLILDRDDIRVKKYLKCETIEYNENIKDGYTLICVGKYPLGFGIAKNNIIKNKFLPFWRMT